MTETSLLTSLSTLLRGIRLSLKEGEFLFLCSIVFLIFGQGSKIFIVIYSTVGCKTKDASKIDEEGTLDLQICLVGVSLSDIVLEGSDDYEAIETSETQAISDNLQAKNRIFEFIFHYISH